ncbi:MAG: 16S rRNA (cytosine(967)-C(5))-methyltransferase RsmB [Thermodesulfovibrionales bacterium]
MPETRSLALDALHAIWRSDRMPKAAIEAVSEGLEARDRAFVMELVYGVLRYRDTLDWLLRDYLRKPGRLPARTMDNLRLGAYQAFFMRVPPWAAVNEAAAMETRYRALANAVLRAALRDRPRIEAAMDKMRRDALDPGVDGAVRASYIATLTSHPLWLIKRWIKRFGFEEAHELAAANNRVPALALRVNTLRATREEVLQRLREMGMGAEAARVSPQGIRLTEPRAFRELSALRGLVTVQDEAAQIVTLMLAPLRGERVLDACAAPGGKTTHMAELMADEGEIVAVEEDGRRIPALRENVSALGLSSVRIINADVSELGWSGPPFDRILLDAPCSSLGVIRRNPDVKYRHRAGDLARFGQRQLGLLRKASAMLRPGGRLLYSVCSTEPEEGEQVVGAFLKSSADFFIIKDIPLGPPGGELVSEGLLRTYPHRHGMDGFFGAVLGKKAT